MNENLTTAVAAMTAALADPAGAPSHPAIFLVLGVVTFALHIAAVSILLGSTGLALFARYKATDDWLRLGSTMAFTAKAATGAAIVLGVAPLLFRAGDLRPVLVRLEHALGRLDAGVPGSADDRLSRALPRSFDPSQGRRGK